MRRSWCQASSSMQGTEATQQGSELLTVLTVKDPRGCFPCFRARTVKGEFFKEVFGSSSGLFSCVHSPWRLRDP